MSAPEDAPARRLVLLRHGRTEWNAIGRAQGHSDVPLDEVGRSQARLAAPAVAAYAPVRLWSSDLARAVETAEAVAEACGLPVETSEAFREYSVGQRSGLTIAEFEEQFPVEYAAWLAGERDAVPDAESDADVLARFLPALHAAMDALRPGECGVVVSHGAALRTALAEVLGIPSAAMEHFVGLGNCHWVELEESYSFWGGGSVRWRVRGYNLAAPSEVALAPTPDFVADGAAR